MPGEQQQFHPNPAPTIGNRMGGSYMHNASIEPTFGGAFLPTYIKQSMPFRHTEFRSSESCPKNFIIFDQTNNGSQVTFHPGIAPKFCSPGLNIHPSYILKNGPMKEINTERELSSIGEDSDDIDALLSLEEEEPEDSDEEDVSTARTLGNSGSESPDSWSSCSSKPKNGRLPLLPKSSSSGSRFNNVQKHRKIKNMVKALRGIVPGGNQMSTVAVLDEAVRYLKSLKVEAQKLEVGAGNMKVQNPCGGRGPELSFYR